VNAFLKTDFNARIITIQCKIHTGSEQANKSTIPCLSVCHQKHFGTTASSCLQCELLYNVVKKGTHSLTTGQVLKMVSECVACINENLWFGGGDRGVLGGRGRALQHSNNTTQIPTSTPQSLCMSNEMKPSYVTTVNECSIHFPSPLTLKVPPSEFTFASKFVEN